MKKAKLIKNIFNKTIYRANDDRYKNAIIAFTTIKYDDNSEEEIITLNKNVDNTYEETWKEVLSKRITNYDDFSANNSKWQKDGRYIIVNEKVKYFEPESLSINEFNLDDINNIKIYNVGNSNEDLVFVEMYNKNGEQYCITCSYSNVDSILSKLVNNYDKLMKKGKVNIKEGINNEIITCITFIVNKDSIDVFETYQNDQYDKSSLIRISLEDGLNKLNYNNNIRAKYKKIDNGKHINLTKEEFNEIISKMNYVDTAKKTEVETDQNLVQFENEPAHEYYWYKEKKSNYKVKIFAGILALAGVTTCMLLSNTNSKNSSTSESNSSSLDSSDKDSLSSIVTKNEESIIDSINELNKKDITRHVTSDIENRNQITTTVTTSEVTTTKTTTKSVASVNSNQKQTTKKATAYTGTYVTVNKNDMMPSDPSNNKKTSSLTPSGTVNKKDMVTAAPNNAKDQAFTRDESTTTQKTTSNKYDYLIITGEIEDNKTLVLKK